MALAAYLMLLTLVDLSLQKCNVDKTPLRIVWEKQLQSDLKSNYDNFAPPRPDNNTSLVVDVGFIMKYFTFSSDEEMLSLQVWMFISWKDERLKWDPKNYSGIDETEIFSSTIWTPSFLIYNSIDSEDFDRFFYVRCKLKSSGSVHCKPRLVHNIRCSVNLANFPYDVQECKLQYGPWMNQKFHMNVSTRAISMWGAGYGSQWTITDYRQESDVNCAVQLNMTFVLEREAMSLAAVIVYPSLVISGLTIACLFLDVRSNARLWLVCFSIFCHFFWLSELTDNIPKESAEPPRLLLYYRASMVLSVLMLPATVILAAVCKKISAPHNIIVTINEIVYGSFARFVVYPRWNVDGVMLTEDNKYVEDWIKFANIVSCLCAEVIVIVYIGLYIAFVPQPVPLKVY